MAEATARAPRRGERGFKAAAERAGGDPRLEQARAGRLRPVQAPPPEGEGAPEDRQAANARQRPGRARRAAATIARPERLAATPLRPGGGLTVNDGAGFVLGALGWVLTVQYLRGGTAGVKAWLRAKFLNQTSGGPSGNLRGPGQVAGSYAAVRER